MFHSRPSLGCTLAIVLTGLFLTGVVRVQAQEESAHQEASANSSESSFGAADPLVAYDPAALQAGQYLGAPSCASNVCHGNVEPRDVYTVRQDEYFIWLEQDRHATAYNVLLTEESTLIGRNMKLGTRPSESAVCLACHSLNVPDSQQSESLDLADGVSCEVCHGPAGGWIKQHKEEGWTHEQSVQAGMTDLRNVTVRAKTCLSCHLGNTKKTVDHELIAAGHPDLIFELDNYSAVMPPHWLAWADKPDKEGRENTHGVQAWAVGQAVAFRQGMRQIAQQARSGNWPEFAEMNCYACHHSLKEGEWRRHRGYKYTAGTPPWNPARYAVLRQLVATFAPQERSRIASQIERLEAAIAKISTPRQHVAATATQLATTLDRVIPRIAQARIDAATARKLARAIANDTDYLIEAEVHSVEQAVMSINALMSSMGRTDSHFANARVSQIIDRLYEVVRDREQFDRNQFSQRMAELQRQLQ